MKLFWLDRSINRVQNHNNNNCWMAIKRRYMFPVHLKQDIFSFIFNKQKNLKWYFQVFTRLVFFLWSSKMDNKLWCWRPSILAQLRCVCFYEMCCYWLVLGGFLPLLHDQNKTAYVKVRLIKLDHWQQRSIWTSSRTCLHFLSSWWLSQLMVLSYI